MPKKTVPRALCAASLLLVTGCTEHDAFRRYQCSTPAERGRALNTSAQTMFTISDAAWDETAVRQVLHVFAFGGFATDAQITAWADMPPAEAIAEMLTLDTVNAAVSPADDTTPVIQAGNGSLKCLEGLFSVESTDNPIAADDREDYALGSYDAVQRTFMLASRVRGLNPVRQRFGLLETNYHLALSLLSGVSNRQMTSFYDDVLGDLAEQLPYEEVLTNAALSAAPARQYNHRENVYEGGQFSGNEDFAREYHQLYFGILGTYDDGYTGAMADLHELVTIPNTAKALTDMPIGEGALDDRITYGQERHWQGALQILEVTNTGLDARERFVALAPTTVAHAESMNNLPVLLVRFLADDTLDPTSSDPAVLDRVATVRALWAGMPRKNLLEFVRKYAISTAFHDPSRTKFWTSIERNMLVTNLTTLTNREAFDNRYRPLDWMYNEDVSVFRPMHDVFGGQTGTEASTTADVFRNLYNRSVQSWWSLSTYEDDGWRKDWGAVVPTGTGGRHRVRTTAEWLWQRYVADGLDHLGPLERAHLYAILADGEDLAYWLDSSNPDVVYTLDQITTSPTISTTIAGAEEAFVNLRSDDVDEREQANYRIGLAINFIVATPYFQAQTGR